MIFQFPSGVLVEYIIGSDGATYEKTTLASGAVFYKIVTTEAP